MFSIPMYTVIEISIFFRSVFSHYFLQSYAKNSGLILHSQASLESRIRTDMQIYLSENRSIFKI